MTKKKGIQYNVKDISMQTVKENLVLDMVKAGQAI